MQNRAKERIRLREQSLEEHIAAITLPVWCTFNLLGWFNMNMKYVEKPISNVSK